jgi:uncharacterized membrane protein
MLVRLGIRLDAAALLFTLGVDFLGVGLPLGEIFLVSGVVAPGRPFGEIFLTSGVLRGFLGLGVGVGIAFAAPPRRDFSTAALTRPSVAAAASALSAGFSFFLALGFGFGLALGAGLGGVLATGFLFFASPGA